MPKTGSRERGGREPRRDGIIHPRVAASRFRMDTGLLRLRWRRRLLSGLFLLMSSLIPPCLGSGSLSGPGSLQQTLTLPRDRFGNPDYCVITRQHTMCNSEVRNTWNMALIARLTRCKFGIANLFAGLWLQVRAGFGQRCDLGREGGDRESAQRTQGKDRQREGEERKTGTAATSGRHGTNGERDTHTVQRIFFYTCVSVNIWRLAFYENIFRADGGDVTTDQMKSNSAAN